jgi:F-type H+-transporting ATPase subunit b
MLDLDFSFVWVAVNFLILYFFLKTFLFGRIGSYMDARAAKIEKDIADGLNSKAEGELFVEQQRAALDEAAAQRRAILADANDQAKRESDAIITEARTESVRILARARESSDHEHARMLTELRGEVADLALAAASKVVSASMDCDANRRLVEDFLQKEVRS